jgi:hypothetical protein
MKNSVFCEAGTKLSSQMLHYHSDKFQAHMAKPA